MASASANPALTQRHACPRWRPTARQRRGCATLSRAPPLLRPPRLQAPAAAPAVAAAAEALFQDGWPLWSSLLACSCVGQLAEARTRWGAALSAPLVSMVAALALAAGGVIPTDCAPYDVVWRYVMPTAAACFLLETDVQRLATDGGPVLLAFLVGAVGMALGALAGWWLLRAQLGAVGSLLAACLCASYVGGSVNFAAVSLALKVPPSAIPGAMAADNLLMAVFLAVLMAVPVQRAAAAAVVAVASTAAPSTSAAPPSPSTPSTPLPTTTTTATTASTAVAADADAGSGPSTSAVAVAAAAATTNTPPVSPPPQQHHHQPQQQQTQETQQTHHQPAPPPPAVTAESLALTLAAAASACAVSYNLAERLDAAPLTLLILAVVAASVAAAAKALLGRAAGGVAVAPPFAGAAQMGNALMGVFFSIIGASAGSLSSLASCGVLVPFMAIMVSVHWVVLAGVGHGLLRLPTEALLLGSNANIGGSATAAGMAAARGWGSLVQPAMLAGSMGYAAGTAFGLAVARVIATSA